MKMYMSSLHIYIYVNYFIFCIHFVVVSTMEVVLDELRKNDVDIDMTTVSYHIRHCLGQYKTMYEQMAIRVGPVDLPGIFNDMNVNNFGRAI